MGKVWRWNVLFLFTLHPGELSQLENYKENTEICSSHGYRKEEWVDVVTNYGSYLTQ